MPEETLMAHIAVIKKEGKDPAQCANYRPISLLNVDLKIFAKILAIRIIPYIPGLYTKIRWASRQEEKAGKTPKE